MLVRRLETEIGNKIRQLGGKESPLQALRQLECVPCLLLSFCMSCCRVRPCIPCVVWLGSVCFLVVCVGHVAACT